MNRISRVVRALVLLAATVALAFPATGAPSVWKLIPNAFLRINDEGVKDWSVYQIEKRDDRFVLEIPDRYLLIIPDTRQVFDLDSARIAHDGMNLQWDPAKIPAKPLATSTWLVRDVGFARRIKLRIDADDRTLDLQIPHSFSRH
jgi:hypothetical protein